MAEIVNLREQRKARDRAAKRAKGDANAAKFGRTKAEREREEARAAKARAFLDSHARALSVRPALPADLPGLLEISGDALPRDEAALTLDTLLRRGRLLVAETGGRLAGMGALDDATIRCLMIAPDRQRRGAGTALMTALLALPEAGSQEVLRLISPHDAVDFYRRFGFRPLDEAEGAILMERRRA